MGRYKFGSILIIASIVHIVKPKIFLAMMPDIIPMKQTVNILTAIFEFIMGVLLWVRKPGIVIKSILILFLIVVYPANIKMAVEKINFGKPYLNPLLYARLPLQFTMINDVKNM